MDDRVKAAMARWPNVPDVYGWLGLSRQGQWVLYPEGNPNQEGETITHPQTRHFIGRNYLSDAQGQWYFQNGPQKVYVCLEAAPWVLHTRSPGADPALHTQTGLPVNTTGPWFVDESGWLYTRTEHGGAIIDGRDVQAVYEALLAPAGRAAHRPQEMTATEIARALGFVRQPRPLVTPETEKRR